MPRIGVSSRGNAWVSMGCLGWLIFWTLALPFVLAWLALKLLVVIVKVIVALVQLIDDRPAIPRGLRTPPPKR